jgi:hypothetical protein
VTSGRVKSSGSSARSRSNSSRSKNISRALLTAMVGKGGTRKILPAWNPSLKARRKHASSCCIVAGFAFSPIRRSTYWFSRVMVTAVARSLPKTGDRCAQRCATSFSFRPLMR